MIVGLGASAGGVDAFRRFFESMPPDSGMGFVVVLHLPAGRVSMLPTILSQWTLMRVSEAKDGDEVLVNHVHVPPPGTVATLKDGRLLLRRLRDDNGREHLPIDVFFDSLAEDLGEDAVAIVLSGTGSDGALGLKAVKERGGFTLAQGGDGTAPQFAGMPDGAVATGAVDLVVPVEDMPHHLIRVRDSRKATGKAVAGSVQETDALRLAICEVVRGQIGHDFSHYKEKTFLRRVQRRMQVVGVDSMDAYLEVLNRDREETVRLFRDLLISVTSFFRDAAAFAALEHVVIPRLFHGKTADSSVRVWVAGCATGEEVYSLAMLLCEHMDGLSVVPHLQLFATDIDEPAIAIARAGRYPPTLLQGLSPARRDRFFSASASGYVVSKEIRKLCTFSAHSLTRDPPFSRVDLVSCRNLLIYLDLELQETIIPAFHYSLVRHGILLLGSAETVSRHADLFEPLDQAHRIYRRQDGPSPPLRLPTGKHRRFDVITRPSVQRDGEGLGARAAVEAGGRILQRFAPPFVVVNSTFEVVHFSSRTGLFLEAPQGAPTRDLFDLARNGLWADLRMALRSVAETGHAVERRDVVFDAEDGSGRVVSLTVERLGERETGVLYLVVFLQSAPYASEDTGGAAELHPAESNDGLHYELGHTRKQLRSVVEQHEIALEELRSANEELNSLNEEMQSTNEELETSKEEIQSVNEELQTVNAQLSAMVEELDSTNSDIRNLFESTEVATVFLDPHLVLRGFTPAVGNVYNLIPSDIGRPLTDIVGRLHYDSLRQDVAHVLRTLEPTERRLMHEDNNTHYLMRILPYRAPDSRVDGTLITFVDVTSIVRAEQHQRLLVDELNHRVKNMLTVVVSLSTQTLRRSRSLDDFAEAFVGRLQSLTAAYTLLSRENWISVKLRDVLEEGLRPFMSRDSANIAIIGPHVALGPRAALALGMAVHELATNAVKHGALSVPQGDVVVAWRIEREADEDLLQLEWTESNGPTVTPPTQRGFGMTLIERSLPHDLAGTAHVEFAPEGVRAWLRAPLPPEPNAGDRTAQAVDVAVGP